MAASTTRYGFPYQQGTDAPDGPDLGKDLAEAVETVVGALEDVGHQFIQQVRFTQVPSPKQATQQPSWLVYVCRQVEELVVEHN
jgi:hypothetical protein